MLPRFNLEWDHLIDAAQANEWWLVWTRGPDEWDAGRESLVIGRVLDTLRGVLTIKRPDGWDEGGFDDNDWTGVVTTVRTWPYDETLARTELRVRRLRERQRLFERAGMDPASAGLTASMQMAIEMVGPQPARG